MSRPTKLLIIGTRDFRRHDDEVRVESIGWEEIRRISNLRDYDALLINLVNLEPADVAWDHFESLLNPSTLEEILRPGGQVIVLGDPRFSTASTANSAEHPFLAWTGLEFDWDASPGDAVEFRDTSQDRSWLEVAAHIEGWQYSLRRVEPGAHYSGLFSDFVGKGSVELVAEADAPIQTRYGYSVAFLVRVVLRTFDQYGRSKRLFDLGPIVFVPKLSLTEEEGIGLILRDLCDIETTQPEPDWLESYTAPGQAQIDSDIIELRNQVAVTVEALKATNLGRDEVRSCLSLLYQRGEPLETAVRDVMRYLGASVEDPEEPGQEDGRIAVRVAGTTYEGVLEVKGTRKRQFGEDGLKQLVAWVDRGIRLREKKYKGIFVGNSEIETPPPDRVEPFSPSFRSTASLHEFAALRTIDLYVAYVLASDGRLEPHEFWSQLFGTNGVVDAREYWARLGSTTLSPAAGDPPD